MRRFLIYTGPGVVNETSWGEYTEEYTYENRRFNAGQAEEIAEAIRDDLDSIKEETPRGLIEYCDTTGCESLTFKDVVNINEQFFLSWILKVNEDFRDEDMEKFKNWLTGQMSDGWGEGFEQHPFATSTYDDYVDVEDYDEESGETNYTKETDHIHEELSFSPWSYSKNPREEFRVEVEELDEISESQEKLTEAHKYWALLTQDQKYARWRPQGKFSKKQEAFDKAEALQEMGLAVSVYQYKKIEPADSEGAGWQWIKVKTYPRLSIEELVRKGLEKRGDAPENFKIGNLEINDTADDYADAYMEATKVDNLRKAKKWRLDKSKFQEKTKKTGKTGDGTLCFDRLREEEEKEEDPWALLDDYVAQYGPKNFTIILSRYIGDAEPEFFQAYDRQLAELQKKTGEGTEETLNGILQWLGHNDSEYLIFDCIEDLKAGNAYTKDLIREARQRLAKVFYEVSHDFHQAYALARQFNSRKKAEAYYDQLVTENPHDLITLSQVSEDDEALDGEYTNTQFGRNGEFWYYLPLKDNHDTMYHTSKAEPEEEEHPFDEAQLKESVSMGQEFEEWFKTLDKDDAPFKLVQDVFTDIYQIQSHIFPISYMFDHAPVSVQKYLRQVKDDWEKSELKEGIIGRLGNLVGIDLEDDEDDEDESYGDDGDAIDRAISFGMDYCLYDKDPEDLYQEAFDKGCGDSHKTDDFEDFIRNQIDWDTFFEEFNDEDAVYADELVFALNDGYYDFYKTHKSINESKLRESGSQIDLLYSKDGFRPGRGGRGFAKSNTYAVQCTHPDNVYNDLKYYLKQDGSKVYHQFRVNVRPCALENALENSISVEQFMKRYEAGEFNDEFKESKLKESYTDPDLLDDLVRAYIHNDMITPDEIWDEIMARYDDECLANDVLAELEAEGWHCAFEESKLREATSSLKITDYRIDERWIYDTFKDAIIINAKINDKDAKFIFRAARGGNIFFTGISCDYVRVPREADTWTSRGIREIRIANDIKGAGFWASPLQIYPDVLKSAPKKNQKDFSFTGRYYSTAPIKDAFKQNLMYLYQKGYLTEDFCEYFNIPPYGTGPAPKSSDSVEKMKKWQAGERGFNLKAASDAKLKANLKICREIGFDDGADKIQAELDSRKAQLTEKKLNKKQKDCKLEEARAKRSFRGYDPDETFKWVADEGREDSYFHPSKYYLYDDDFSDLRQKYANKLRQARADYAKAHPEYRDEYDSVMKWQSEASKKRSSARTEDPELAELAKKIADAERYSNYARKKGWWSTVKKQDALRSQLVQELEDKEKAYYDYDDPESRIYKTRPAAEHIDAYWALEDPIIDEYIKERDQQEQEFADALKDKKIYLGRIKGDDDKYYKSFFRATDDPEVFKRIGSRGRTSHPYGPNRGYSEFHIAPDARTEYEDVKAEDIEDLKEYPDPHKWEYDGCYDSTD